MNDYSYRYFPKALKQLVDQFDVEQFDYLIKKQAWGQLSYIYDSLAKVHSEGCPLSQDQQEALQYPFKLWGRDAATVLEECRKTYLEDRKKQKQK